MSWFRRRTRLSPAEGRVIDTVEVGGFPVVFSVIDGQLSWVEDDRLSEAPPHLRTFYDMQIEEHYNRLQRFLRMNGLLR